MPRPEVTDPYFGPDDFGNQRRRGRSYAQIRDFAVRYGLSPQPYETADMFEERVQAVMDRTRMPQDDPRMARIGELMDRLGDLQIQPQAERMTQEEAVRLAQAMEQPNRPATPEEQRRVIMEHDDGIDWNFLKAQLKKITTPMTEKWLERWRRR